MIEFMSVTFFGTIFIFTMKYLLNGLLFLDRVLLVIMFDFDYVESGRKWVRKSRDAVRRVIVRLKQNSEIRKKKQDEEAKTIYVIDEGEE